MKYFKEKEVEGLAHGLVEMLDRARGFAGVPFVLTETVRPKSSKIGARDSAHYRGRAVDIRCHTPSDRFKILNALFSVGFKRIGIYDKHVHCDCDLTLPQEVVWTGTSK